MRWPSLETQVFLPGTKGYGEVSVSKLLMGLVGNFTILGNKARFLHIGTFGGIRSCGITQVQFAL